MCIHASRYASTKKCGSLLFSCSISIERSIESALLALLLCLARHNVAARRHRRRRRRRQWWCLERQEYALWTFIISSQLTKLNSSRCSGRSKHTHTRHTHRMSMPMVFSFFLLGLIRLMSVCTALGRLDSNRLAGQHQRAPGNRRESSSSSSSPTQRQPNTRLFLWSPTVGPLPACSRPNMLYAVQAAHWNQAEIKS